MVKRPINLGELYDGMTVQTDYQHHSPYWNSLIEENTQKLAREMRRVEEEEEQQAHMKKTVNLNDLYDNINLQTEYENHSDLWH
jgi:hypothetical protein